MSHRTWIKMCGMTRLEDAREAAELGIDAVGFVFAESPRRISPEAARSIVRDLPPHLLRFGVFVDESPSEIARILQNVEIDRIQLHGFEEPMVRELTGTRVVSAFRARDESVLEEIRASPSQFFLLDTWSAERVGGTGTTFEWSIARRAVELGKLVLAGGLDAENVGEAIRTVRPFGVDVSSGIEVSPGVKDPERMRAFVEAVRTADHELAQREPTRG